jgi:hypothetical protein
MPVRKFRSLAEAERSVWLEPGDPRIWEAHLRRWRLHRFFARETAPRRAPGVYRFASLDEKQRSEARPLGTGAGTSAPTR